MEGNAACLTCYTTGYGNLPFAEFLRAIQDIGIGVIVDVRSIPFSRFNPSFRRPGLERLLPAHGIAYRFLGDYIGGRRTEPDLLLPDGSTDYGKVRATMRFQEGIEQLQAILTGNKRVAMMCAELDPARCHRFHLISPALLERGIRVIHILPGGAERSHEDLMRIFLGGSAQATLGNF